MMETSARTRLYRTEPTLNRTLRVACPSGRGRMVLRTEKDREKSLEPAAVSEGGNVSTFEVEADQPLLYVFRAMETYNPDKTWSPVEGQ